MLNFIYNKWKISATLSNDFLKSFSQGLFDKNWKLCPTEIRREFFFRIYASIS